jgi:hypothetical protein
MLLLVNHFLQRTHCRRRTDLMPTYAPSWEQTSPSTPPVHMGGGDFDTQGECGSRSSCSPGGVGTATDSDFESDENYFRGFLHRYSFPYFLTRFLTDFLHIRHADFNGEHLSYLNKTNWPCVTMFGTGSLQKMRQKY